MGDSLNKTRNVLMDNIKGILIISVVFGHMLAIANNSTDNNVFSYVHYLIYSVHMPMFIMVSGLFSKGYYDLRKFLKGCLIPYLTFDLLFNVFCTIAGGEKLDLNVFYTNNGYWYILCIGIMRLLYKYIRPTWILIVTSIIVSIIMIYMDESIFKLISMGRVFLLFPSFIIGVRIDLDNNEKVKNHLFMWIILAVVTILSESALYFYNIVRVATHSQPDTFMSLLFKYLYMFLFTPICFSALLAIIPNRRIPLVTKCGENSIMVYLLHFFAVKIIVHIAKTFGMPYNVVFFIIFLIISLMISWTFSQEVFNKIYNMYIKKVMRILHLC